MKLKLIIFVAIFFPFSALAQPYNDTMAYRAQAEDNYDISKLDKTVSEKTDKQAVPPDIEVDSIKAREVIRTEKTLCIKDECKSSWPTLKCAEFNSRPAGESGETFCKSAGKTCFAVFVGSGSSFFAECSTPPVSVHKTRCCWVE